MPIAYLGCKIYISVAGKKWRVMPKPGQSVYDRAFAWGDDPETKWSMLLEYCENPVLPAGH